MTSLTRLTSLFFLMLLVTFFTSCGGDDDEDKDGQAGEPSSESPTETPTADAQSDGSTITPTLTPNPTVKTGVAIVDEVIASLTSVDLDALVSLVRFEMIPCGGEAVGFPAPPKCSTEPEGTPVPVLLVEECEGFYVREAEIRMTFEAAIRSVEFYAAFPAGSQAGPPGAEYVILFDRSPAPNSVAIWVDDENISLISFGCGQAAGEVARLLGLGSPITSR